MTTVKFINAVGFHENRTAVVVDFKYSGSDENGTDVDKTLSVPFLAMLPIPNLEVRIWRAPLWRVCRCVCATVACCEEGAVVMRRIGCALVFTVRGRRLHMHVVHVVAVW